jgi:hypothetical protein
VRREDCSPRSQLKSRARTGCSGMHEIAAAFPRF